LQYSTLTSTFITTYKNNYQLRKVRVNLQLDLGLESELGLVFVLGLSASI